MFVFSVLQVTLVSAFAFPDWHPRGMNVYFAICIVLICGSHIVLVSDAYIHVHIYVHAFIHMYHVYINIACINMDVVSKLVLC